MSEPGLIAIWVLVLVAVYVLTRIVNAWRASRACSSIVKELESKGAHDPGSAVPLKGTKRNMARAGLRDFRPEGIKMLLLNDAVEMTRDERYYLKDRPGQFENSAHRKE